MLSSMVLSSFIVAPAGLLARQYSKHIVGWSLALLPFVLFLIFSSQIGSVVAGETITETYTWVDSLGVNLSFVLDGLSLLFALIITGIGTLIVIYTRYYMAEDEGMGRFYLYLLVFMGSMLGVVLAGNILTMFVFWELTSASSYLLIGFKHEKEESRWGAQQGLLITAGGGIAMLVGLLLLGEAAKLVGVPATEAYTFASILGAGEQIKETALYAPALMLILLGCFTKSAQFPFHFWLPNAMQAPTPASAFLHSATMVKAGIYLMARLHPGLGETALWSTTLILFGGTTMLVSSVLAVRQHDTKALLAYSTVSKLGTMTLLLGIGGEYALEAVVVLILAHALYKSSLFMVAGIVDHEAGTRDMRKLGGLRHYMPWTMGFAVFSGLSMAGIPIFFGFVSKEWQLKAALESPMPFLVDALVVIAIVASAVLTIVYTWRFVNEVFLGRRGTEMNEHVHEPPRGMLISPGIPAALSLIVCLGFLPGISSLLQPAAGAVASSEVELHLYLWEGINLAFILSMLAIIGGAVLARNEGRVRGISSPLPAWADSDKIYDNTIDGLLHSSKSFTKWIQNGRLRVYVTVIFITLLVIVGPIFLQYGTEAANMVVDLSSLTVIPHELVAALLIGAGVIATIRARSRVGAIISLGVVGAMISLLFVLFSAPDLALTQLLIEVLSTVFLLLVFSVLPARFANLSSNVTRIRDAVIAAGAGLLMAGLAFVAATSDLFPSIAPYYLENSIPEGEGYNVVNVILVDFRSLDTLGEITVLFIAALGIYGLLRMRQERPAPEVQTGQDGNGAGLTTTSTATSTDASAQEVEVSDTEEKPSHV